MIEYGEYEHKMDSMRNDFSIGDDGKIRHIGGDTIYSALDFHRYIQDWFDDNLSHDLCFKANSERVSDYVIRLVGLSIDDECAMFLKQGSIVQHNGMEVYDLPLSLEEFERETRSISKFISNRDKNEG